MLSPNWLIMPETYRKSTETAEHPINIADVNPVDAIKRGLKTHLFRKAFGLNAILNDYFFSVIFLFNLVSHLCLWIYLLMCIVAL